MRMWAIGTASATLLTAGFVAFGAGSALADSTNGNDSILGGNQVNAPISIPINVSGNSVAVLGRATSGSTGGAYVQGARLSGGHHGRTSGRHSILGGNQINAPITAPINACGNSVAALGGALSGCQGGAGLRRTGYADGGHQHTSGVDSIGGGNQVNAPITAPVNVCGNSAAVLGDALAGCRGGAGVEGARLSGGHARTSGRHSVLGGNQVHAPINAPIDVCGNAVGNALAGCQGGATVSGAAYHTRGGHTDGRHSIGGGNQVDAPITAPVDVCGNAAAVLGHGLAACQGTVGAPAAYYGDGFHGRTSGRHSILGGNQVHAPINAPIDVCGNAVAVVGHALGGCQGGSGYGVSPEDCPPGTYRMSGRTSGEGNGLPQLPVDPSSLRAGALPVAMGATPALPQLPGREIGREVGELTPQSARQDGPLGGLGVPAVGGPVKPLPVDQLPVDQLPAKELPVKQLPPVDLAAADSATPGSPSGALAALVLGGLFAASAGTVTVARRLGRRAGR